MLSRVQLFCDPMYCSLLGSSDHGILQARILDWVAMAFSRGSSQSGDPTGVSWVSCIGKWILLPVHHLGSSWTVKILRDQKVI